MKIYKGTVVQTIAGENKVFEIDTGLGVLDQKTLWELKAFEANWDSGHGMIKGTEPWYLVQATLTRSMDKVDYLDDEVISQLKWTAQGGSGVAGDLIPFESIKRDLLLDTPWIANSKLYVVLLGYTTEKQTMDFKIAFEERKVTELEFLKAQTGYCVC